MPQDRSIEASWGRSLPSVNSHDGFCEHERGNVINRDMFCKMPVRLNSPGSAPARGPALTEWVDFLRFLAYLETSF
ncbi:MAG: hypothetical protein AUI33_05390 [Ignavibacteria bacterium 13_1_40CM_2_61_4]|nr:MAG: hypothetical protein AUI33_05390 [Ignavibacteria bacterium 13_1_40CM_2_61_4]